MTNDAISPPLGTAETGAKEQTIQLPDGRIGGTALVDMAIGDDGWTLALFNRSTWLGRGEDDEPYTGDGDVFLVRKDGARFTVYQTVATMLEN